MSNKKEATRDMIKGISFLNPVDVDRDYYLFVVDYAIKNGFDHVQLIGPTHHNVKGNVDGMIYLKKYAQFNGEKDKEYVDYCLDCVNEAINKAHDAGLKNFFWHHELDLPNGFKEAFPETLNENGDIEVTHPIVKDYLENRLYDFFDAYPNMDGLILTLHETKVPLLKLKNQKLDKIGRVKYVTEILYKTCKELGKELIVRPFASLEEDYIMMTKAYEQISTDMLMMDKWTQFDWSLTAPHNQFFKKIENNPLFVEADIYGEFFGKGRLPLMLKDHIKQKFAYCEQFKPAGYVARIDRNGNIPFNTVQEVNLVIYHAVISGLDVDEAIAKFMKERYGENYQEVIDIMENTEEILKKIIYLKGYYYSELSMFPTLNHCKNHFYFEMMKKDWKIASNEWFIPINWERGDIEGVFEEKREARDDAKIAYEKALKLKGRIPDAEYEKLFVQFANLALVAEAWYYLTEAHFNYARYMESGLEQYKNDLFIALDKLLEINERGEKLLGNKFLCLISDGSYDKNNRIELIKDYVRETKISFAYEDKLNKELLAENLTDYVICGGANESHKLQKEVNFSDSMIIDDELCRICGHRNGLKWSAINAHGWFSYEVKVKEGQNNIELLLGSATGHIDVKVDIDGEQTVITEAVEGKKSFTIPYTAKAGQTSARIRFDRISANTPCVYSIKVK